MTNHTPLTVYKASAGSGKTFTLAIEYISLLIKDPKSYEHILAVTFTNKATEEMKMRIISQLYGIWKQLPDSKGYLEAIKKKTGKLEHDIIKRSGEALSYLIHNYNYFRVQTIDAFFQSVLRNLARELELTANLKVDLNDRQIEEQAVDEMIESLDMDARVLRWISDYIDKNIKDDLSWNVIRSIKDFGRNIFKDFYKKHSKELDELMRNEKFFDEYTKTLRLRRDTIEKNLSNDARTLQSMLQEESFDDPSLYKYGDKGTVLKYVRTIGKQTRFDNSPTPPRVLQFMDDPEKMIAKVDRRDAFISYAQTTLIPKLQSFEKKRLYLWSEYQSAVLTLRHLSQLRLLHAIAETVDEINKRTNRFQLSNTQSLLNSLIKDDDSPFIFEKLGAQLKHIMIDEFQDTSHIQWENFKVLLEDCLAQTGSQSLIVGDVKQSIYRWRSSDWKMLNNIDSEFTEKQMCLQPLTTNYRSQQKIVEFNNAFFEQAVKVTTDELQNDSIDGSEQLMKAYKTDELKQKIHKDKGKGYIRIELLPSSQYRETILEKLLTNVDELLSHGIETKDIAILVRSNSDIRDIATLFMQERPGLRIVSDEAFRLDASLSVNMLVQALRLLSHPEDILTKAKLVKAYNQEVLKNGMSDTQLFVGNDINKYLPQEFFHTEELLMMPLVDLVDRLYTIFQLHFIEHQSAYVCAFYDVLNNYLQDNTADIDSFLQEWEESLHEKTIQSDEQEGLHLLSIHKSKGLEFDHVIIPFCDWRLEMNDTIWCEKKAVDPYDKLPILPIDFSKKGMMGTVYESDYKEEHLQNVVDNMNMLYVAFTRAGKSLMVTGKRMSKKRIKDKSLSFTSFNRSEVIEESLQELSRQLAGSILSGMEEEKDEILFEYGELSSVLPSGEEEQKPIETGNVFMNPVSSHTIHIETFRNPVEFRQSNKSKEFVADDEVASDSSLTYIKLGNILHALFSTIRTTDDIESRLQELELDGVIYDNDLSAENIREKLNRALENQKVRDWFSPKWTLFNECTILTRNRQTDEMQEYRPDRVMSDGFQTIVVDFKFGAPRNEYQQQVLHYMDLLREMGHPRVQGFLWYVLRNQITEVCPPVALH